MSTLAAVLAVSGPFLTLGGVAWLVQVAKRRERARLLKVHREAFVSGWEAGWRAAKGEPYAGPLRQFVMRTAENTR